MGGATSAEVHQFSKEIPEDGTEESILQLARERFGAEAVDALGPKYEEFKARHVAAVAAQSINRKCVSDIDVEFFGMRMLVRVDFNVPLDPSTGIILDSKKIEDTIPTIQYLLDNHAKSVVLMSHLGRPCGTVIEQYSLARSVHKCLQDKLGQCHCTPLICNQQMYLLTFDTTCVMHP